LPTIIHVKEHRGRAHVEIFIVVNLYLVPPLQRPIPGIKYHETIREQIGSKSRLSVKIWRSVADRHKYFAGHGIQRIRCPRPTSSRIRRIPLPGVRAKFPFFWNEMEFPDLSTTLCIERVHAPLNAEISARDSNKNQTVPRDGSCREILSGVWITGTDFPESLSSFRTQC
jgi:hypothetical protein